MHDDGRYWRFLIVFLLERTVCFVLVWGGPCIFLYAVYALFCCGYPKGVVFCSLRAFGAVHGALVRKVS